MSTAPVNARLSPDDPAFPSALRALPERGLGPVRPVHVRGAWPAREGVAIVGTRSPSDEALAFTRDLATTVTSAGWAVWSGGAVGIDAEAHEAALRAGGRTVVVCPSGLDLPYPKAHAGLFERVVRAGGMLLSVREDDQPPTLAAFHYRNAVLAALTIATIVVEAPLRSGARSTARAARQLRKPLYVVPHAPWDERGAGCALELERRARAIADARAVVVTLMRDLARDAQMTLAIDVDPSHARERSQASARMLVPASAHGPARSALTPRQLQDMGDDARRVFDAIGQTPIHADDLCELTELGPGVVAAALLTLTLGAVVVEAPAGFYRRTSPP